MQFKKTLIISISFWVSVSTVADLTFSRIEVEMGSLGNDDDIRLKVCEGSQCCTTQVLSVYLSSSDFLFKKI